MTKQTKATKQPQPRPTTREVAYNPLRRKWEVVYEEDEVPAGQTITQYWSDSLGWVTIPE